MKKKRTHDVIRVVSVNPAEKPKTGNERQHPCAQISEQERRQGIVDILSQALIQLKRKRSPAESC